MHFDSVLNTRMILAAAAEARVDRDALLDAAGIAPGVVADPFASVPASQQFALLHAAVERSGDPAFGLHMARCWNRPGAMDAVGYEIAASGTFRDMIEGGYESLRRFSNLQDIWLETAPKVARIVYRPARTDWPMWPVLSDFYMASVAIQGRLLIDPEFGLIEAAFPRPAPADPAPYVAVFGDTLRFEQLNGELLLAPHWLDAPSRLADRELQQVMAGMVAKHAPDPEPSGTLAARARSALQDMLRDGAPALKSLAERLRMRPRTLQHQLRREGLTYGRLVDDVRRELVLTLLRADETTLDEIAWRAGYGSQTSLFRSFRRWTGRSPGEYRRERHER